MAEAITRRLCGEFYEVLKDSGKVDLKVVFKKLIPEGRNMKLKKDNELK